MLELQKEAATNGLNDMGLDEINAEIAASRKERQSQRNYKTITQRKAEPGKVMMPSEEEFRKSLDDSQEWAASVGPTEGIEKS